MPAPYARASSRATLRITFSAEDYRARCRRAHQDSPTSTITGRCAPTRSRSAIPARWSGRTCLSATPATSGPRRSIHLCALGFVPRIDRGFWRNGTKSAFKEAPCSSLDAHCSFTLAGTRMRQRIARQWQWRKWAGRHAVGNLHHERKRHHKCTSTTNRASAIDS